MFYLCQQDFSRNHNYFTRAQEETWRQIDVLVETQEYIEKMGNNAYKVCKITTYPKVVLSHNLETPQEQERTQTRGIDRQTETDKSV